jgi:hypothetical protein
MVFGLFKRRNVYGLRKQYDKQRERIDKLNDIKKRIAFLQMLDQLEPQLISLEEHMMPNFEKKRLYDFIESGLRKAKFLIEEEKKKGQNK